MMFRQLAAGIAALGFLAGSAAGATDPAAQELETFVVSGEQPGPGLWKVSKGDHVMWVLARYGPLPKDMTWRTKEIEARIAESQEVLYPVGVNIGANIGILRGLTLIPAALKASKIPDGRTLKDVLSADTYNKWLALRLKYIGKDDRVEKLRPSLALEALYGEVVKKHGLAGGPNVFAVVGDLRKKHKVASSALPTVSRTLNVENPRGILKNAQKLQLPDVQCFTDSLGKVEPEVERIRKLANAWARGDIQIMRGLLGSRKLRDALQERCTYALATALNEGASTDAVHAKKMFDDAMWHMEQASVQAQIDWVAAAQKSLERNQSTFAVLPVGDVFRSDGHLEKLRELGYSVEEPR
jgi:hypothetical protein